MRGRRGGWPRRPAGNAGDKSPGQNIELNKFSDRDYGETKSQIRRSRKPNVDSYNIIM